MYRLKSHQTDVWCNTVSLLTQPSGFIHCGEKIIFLVFYSFKYVLNVNSLLLKNWTVNLCLLFFLQDLTTPCRTGAGLPAAPPTCWTS